MEKLKATDELYRKCEGTIKKACLNAWIRNPLVPFDDYLSYADEVFMDAVNSFDPAAGAKFNSWLTTQLLRLKPYANRGGLMTTDSRGTAESLVLSLDKKAPGALGSSPKNLHEKGGMANDDYTKKISAGEEASGWECRMNALKPYLAELSPDARTMVNDILDGNAAKKDAEGAPKLEPGRRLYARLTPRQLYIRLYRRRGWEFERVRDARVEIEEMFRRAALYKLPEREDELRLCSLGARVIRDGSVVAKTDVTFDRFEKAVESRVPAEVLETQVQDELF